MTEPEFLNVKLGDTVLVGVNEIAKIVSFVEGARDSATPTLFKWQIWILVKSNMFMLLKLRG